MDGADREAPGRDTVVARGEQVITAQVGEELAMMDVESGSQYVLDDIASYVWSAIDPPRRVGDLLAEIQLTYDVPPTQCESDVVALLERMRDQGLVHLT